MEVKRPGEYSLGLFSYSVSISFIFETGKIRSLPNTVVQFPKAKFQMAFFGVKIVLSIFTICELVVKEL